MLGVGESRQVPADLPKFDRIVFPIGSNRSHTIKKNRQTAGLMGGLMVGE